VKVKKTSSKNFDMVEEKGGHTGHGLELGSLVNDKNCFLKCFFYLKIN
jgi:hypothetical protein